MSGFFTANNAAGSSSELAGETKALFERLGQAYVTAKLVDTAETLHLWLSELRVFTDQGNLESSEAVLLELADVIVEFGEIDLLQRQSKQIAREVISLVRRKVAHTTTLVPAAEDTLTRRTPSGGQSMSSRRERLRFRLEKKPGCYSTRLDWIDIASVVGLRDRALIGLMTYSFARVGAVLKMQVKDYFVQNRRGHVRLHGKGARTRSPMSPRSSRSS